MRDKSLEVMLILLFGVSGIAILMLAWLWPTVVPERIPATFIGSFGVFVAILKVLRLKSPQSRAEAGQVPIRVGAEDKG
ncbi:hypothetical protein ACFLXF_00705 [Chloroflexota bacterium]